MPFTSPIRAARGRAGAGAGAGAGARAGAGGAAAAALAVALLLGSCTGAPGPSASPSPSPTEDAAPIFESDEEALAAAVEAYGAYLAVIDDVGHAGGEDSQRVRSVASAEYAEELIESFERLKEGGLHTDGRTSFDRPKLAETSTGRTATVSMYLCYDVSDVRVLNTSGQDVTPADRPERTAIQVHLESAPAQPQTLIVEGSETWRGEDFCS